MQIAKKFRNFSKEDFSWKFNGDVFTFPAGQDIYLEGDKADHFAKHLIDRELNRENVEAGRHGTKNEVPTSNPNERARLLALCFPTDEIVTSLEALNINEKAKKGKKKVDEEFADLN